MKKSPITFQKRYVINHIIDFPMECYEKSQKHECVKLTRFSKQYSERIIKSATSKDRIRYAEELLKYLSAKFNISCPQLQVLNCKRKINNKGTSQTYGLYVVQLQRIVIYNLTAIKGEVISNKMFYHTLLHEFMHHYDHKVLRLKKSLHTSAFFKRINDLRLKLGTIQ